MSERCLSRVDLVMLAAGGAMERKTWFNVWYIVFAILGVFWLRELYVTATQVPGSRAGSVRR